MKMAEDIIIKPIITEKSNIAISEGKYTFEVAPNATKTEIRQAVEKLFQVKVISVNTINVLGKEKRVGVHQGKTSNWKKAIVKIDLNPKDTEYLAKGGKATATKRKYKDSIEEFNGAKS